MKALNYLKIGLLALTCLPLQAQQFSLEGYLFEDGNRGFVRNVQITVLKHNSQEIFAETLTDKNGVFNADLPIGQDYLVIAEKKHFVSKEVKILATSAKVDSKIFTKIKMERKPGYVFDVTVAEAGKGTANVSAIQGARIEVFNNTTGKEELLLKEYPHPNFKFNFEKGNHYTLMIRRKGYLNKRIEAYINIDGCILCFDGLGIVDPGVTDVMTNSNRMGTFLANIELEPLEINKTFEIENIYYDFNKWAIRQDAALELDKLIGVLQDNPGIIIEMGSHTDARGRDPYNLSLSEKRAQAAVEYLAEKGIDQKRLTWKGYGESQLVNQCKNGINCSEDAHQRNRRTELKIVGIEEVDPLDNKSLRDILAEERLMKEVMEGDVIKVDKNGEMKVESQNE
ncbi:MAG: OmpA family protein [Bacteroidota bacterium]